MIMALKELCTGLRRIQGVRTRVGEPRRSAVHGEEQCEVMKAVGSPHCRATIDVGKLPENALRPRGGGREAADTAHITREGLQRLADVRSSRLRVGRGRMFDLLASVRLIVGGRLRWVHAMEVRRLSNDRSRKCLSLVYHIVDVLHQLT